MKTPEGTHGEAPKTIGSGQLAEPKQQQEAKETENNKLPTAMKGKGPDNILVRFYKRYVADNHEQDYDCDNFSKL